MVFVRVTVTAVIDAAVPCDKLNGMVRTNWLPVALDAEFPYQVENAEPSGTVRSDWASVELVAGAKWNRPLTISRVVE